jgi:replicative DNA helicase
MALDIYIADTENALIGAILIGGLDTFDEVQSLLNSADFFKNQNEDIWTIFAWCSENREPISVLIVADKIKNKSVNLAYLAALMGNYPDPGKVKEYASIIKKQSMARRKINLCQDQILQLKSGSDPEEVISKSLISDSEILENKSQSNINYIGANILQVVETVEERFNSKQQIAGLRTGYPELDYILGGLDPDTINVVAARPGTGKTTLSLNIAKNISLKYGPVYFGSLEMSFQQLQGKMLAQESGINSMALRNTNLLKASDIDLLTTTAAKVSNFPIIIDDSVEMKASQLAIRLRQYKKKCNLQLAIIDYFQLIEPEKRSSNRMQELNDSLKILKKITRELKIPIWLISQMNRAIEARGDKEPILSDLRETGYIEQDAASVMFLYQDKKEQDEDLVTMKIAKNRFGPADFKIKFIFEKEKSLFRPEKMQMKIV